MVGFGPPFFLESMQTKAFLRLIRLPNVFTAACNSLAGALVAGVGFDRWPALIMLALSSMCIYAAGILWNDLFDLEEDRRERPTRPLPSGQIPVRLAWLVSTLRQLEPFLPRWFRQKSGCWVYRSWQLYFHTIAGRKEMRWARGIWASVGA